MSGLLRSERVSSGMRKQIRHAIEHPIDTLRSALPARSTTAVRVARAAGVVALATARTHPILWGTALVAAVGLGWLYLRRQPSSDSEPGEQDSETQQTEERKPAASSKRARKPGSTGRSRARAAESTDEDSSNEDETDNKGEGRTRRSQGGARSARQ